MKQEKIKYILSIDSRIDELVSMESKHRQVFDFLKSVKGNWGLDPKIEFSVPSFGSDITAFYSLSKKLGAGLKGDIMYKYRRLIKDHHLSDDRVWIEFSNNDVYFHELIHLVAAKYIKGFGAYSLSIYPKGIINANNAFPPSIGSNFNSRKCLDFFYPFQYMDDQLIRNIFHYGKNELLFRLQNAEVLVEIIEDGVFFKAADRFVTVNEAIEFNNRMQSILNITLPIINN